MLEVEVYRLKPGDLLVSEASGSASEVGNTAIWNDALENCCFQNTLLRVRTKGPVPEYLKTVLQYSALSGAFGRAAPGVGIHHLGAARLSAWPIPVPPLDEQLRIVAEIEQHLSVIGAMRDAIEAATKRSTAIRRSILERAFRGELVPQDPTDEPASALLERIAAERAQVEPARSPRRVHSRR
jgi:type I restriction enzyme S subunit